jgi:hypothetical protein
LKFLFLFTHTVTQTTRLFVLSMIEVARFKMPLKNFPSWAWTLAGLLGAGAGAGAGQQGAL